jgi:septal ring factor EnvC (AmiA/AmiB activator)
MNKVEELAILSAAAKKLGNDSYLGGALLALLPFVESQMRSDIFPDLAGSIRMLENDIVENRKSLKSLEERIAEKKMELGALESSVISAKRVKEESSSALREMMNKLSYYAS